MSVNPDLNPLLMSFIMHGTGKDREDVEDLANLVSPEVSLVDFVAVLTEPPCVNPGCNRHRSNFSDECFECRFEPYGSEWEREQMERR